MKKYIFLFFVLYMAAGFAAADDDSINLSIGLEFGIENAGKADYKNLNHYLKPNDLNLYLKPMLIYADSFFKGALDVYGELYYKFGFTKTLDSEGNEVSPQSLYFDLLGGYNLDLGSASTMSFILENELDELVISPRLDGVNALTGILTPAVKYSHELNFGELSARIGAPITYVRYIKKAGVLVGLDLTLGWDSAFGLGIETKLCTLLSPTENIGYKGIEATISYVNGSLYGEIETIIPGKIGDMGVTITPELRYTWWDLTFYVKCEISGIGRRSGGAVISPALGIKFSF